MSDAIVESSVNPVEQLTGTWGKSETINPLLYTAGEPVANSPFYRLQATPIEPEVFDSPLDKGIEKMVLILREAGIETYESCEGGEGHAYPEPTVRFHGDKSEGFRAYAWAIQHQLPVKALRRTYVVIDDELDGPTWEMVFWAQANPHIADTADTASGA